MLKPLVFIIEDDPLLSNVFSLTLKEDFEIRVFLDGLQAMEELAQTSPALIVLDMNLPGASGDQILNYIHSQKRLQATKIILATADALQADLFEHKADLALLKPVSPAQLRELSLRLVAVDK
jgi:CheY-like chemotaxis protein